MKSNRTGIKIVFDKQRPIQAFAAAELNTALEKESNLHGSPKGLAARAADSITSIVLCERDTPEAQKFLRLPGVKQLPASVPQGYSIRKSTQYGDTQIYVIGVDETGTLYGALDVVRAIQINRLATLTDSDRKPYLSQRGIKFNIPLDARTPSYSDSGDSAQANLSQVWETSFWHEFLDEMARNRFNVLSLWSLHPFPSLVKVPEYPQVALEDVKQNTVFVRASSTGKGASTPESRASLRTVKRLTMEEKIAFWREVMQYAKERGISIYLFTWNTFVYGTEDSGHSFTTQLSDLETQDYFRQSVKATLKTYPMLAGIGITAGENMSRDVGQDEEWLFNTYGQGINDALLAEPGRRFRLIHRGHWADLKAVRKAFDKLHPNCSLEWSYKYSRAHMYASTRPAYIHTDGFLDDLGGDKTWLTVRDDDFYLFRWADADFARSYLQNMPLEKLEGFNMGPDGLVWGRETSSREPDSPRQLIMKKRWLSFSMWGNLAYDPTITNAEFVGLVKSHFPQVNADRLYGAWSTSSKIIPLVNRFHSMKSSSDYQWYPEACTSYQGFHDVDRFINDSPQRGEGLMSIAEYATAVLEQKAIAGTTPFEIARTLAGWAEGALQNIPPSQNTDSKELQRTRGDIECMALLGHYYANKISGATNKHLADKAPDALKKQEYREAAIQDLKVASTWWRLYAAKVGGLYLPQTLNRITSGKERQTDIPKLQQNVDADIVLAGRAASPE